MHFSALQYSKLLSSKLFRTCPVLPWYQEKSGVFSLWRIILLELLDFHLRNGMHFNRMYSIKLWKWDRIVIQDHRTCAFNFSNPICPLMQSWCHLLVIPYDLTALLSFSATKIIFYWCILAALAMNCSTSLWHSTRWEGSPSHTHRMEKPLCVLF